jgi:ribosomal protein S18 acetylase RimI-like enzyme
MEQQNVTFDLLDKRNKEIIHSCARLMSESEPWITLKRTFEDTVKKIEDDVSEVHVAKINGEFVGFAIIKMHGAFVGYIQSVAIETQFRDRGIGKRFMKYLEDRIFSEKPNVFICVSSFNPRARRLYEGLGYDTVGELKNYIVNGHSEILMRKSIAPLSTFKRKKK